MKRILILDPNPDFSEELSLTLSRAGFEVCGLSQDGKEGLALIEKTSPDVVVLSLLLSSCDGLSVLEQTKASGKKIDFLVLGNFPDDKLIGRIISLGARYYLMKPVSVQLVCDRVGELTEEATVKAERYERRRAGTLDERISNIFIAIGIPPHIKGYAFLREGIKMAVADPGVINNVTKGLYPVIGEKFNTTPSKVERAIRHAIEVAWNRGRADAVNAIFGARVYIGTERPTNSEFIALIADKLILENMM